MKSVLSVKMLAAFTLVLLVSSVTEGRILSKCELKDKLKAALGGNQGGNVTPGVGNVTGAGSESVSGNVTAPGNVIVTVPENKTVDLVLIAKIVCSVERVSKFNTNLVTIIRGDVKPPAGPPPRPEQRPNGRPGEKPSQGRHGGRGKRSPRGGRFGDSSEEDSSESSAHVPITLYGIFQLSDRVACSSGSGQSLNICRMNCSALIDDDIRDDITCLQTLLDSVNNAGAPAPQDKTKHSLFVKECLKVNPLQYFALCV
ncbi:uncharacterized protein [Chanodichthys erythropterus]|uniref:uncharacterized protein n=1 Tax=Chanodichthys erythropterus TaxID=933992 RepID=UPI00351E20B5